MLREYQVSRDNTVDDCVVALPDIYSCCVLEHIVETQWKFTQQGLEEKVCYTVQQWHPVLPLKSKCEFITITFFNTLFLKDKTVCVVCL